MQSDNIPDSLFLHSSYYSVYIATRVCFVLRLRGPLRQKCFRPNNASAVRPYTALAMVQGSCRWVTAALTIQLAASLIGLKSVGCIKV